MVARLTRLLPIFVFVILASFAAYFLIARLSSTNRARQVLINAYMIICSALSAVFLIFILYAVFEKNWGVVDFGLTFLIPALAGLLTAFICRAIFVKKNPTYDKTPAKAEVINPRPWRQIIDAILRLFGYTRTK